MAWVKLIHVFGTSHVSQDSLDLVEEKIEEIDPEIVALELDATRLRSLLDEEETGGGELFPRVLKAFQDFVGSKTGVMPGDEMLYAYEIAINDGRDVALIDQDISVTLEKLKKVRRVEKVKAVFHIILGVILPGRLEMEDIPEERVIEELLEEFRYSFPGLYRVMIEERNRHMIEALKQLENDNEGDIVAFIGAGHRRAVEEGLENEIDS